MSNTSSAQQPGRRAVLYIRTGGYTAFGASDLGPLEEYAAEEGYTLVETYRDENVSGRDRHRAGLARLLDDAAQGRFDVVVVSHRSTLASTEVEAQPIIDQLRGHGVAIE